jgi:hypothetical protein
VGCDRTDLAAQSVALVADGDPADAVRHGWGGEARDQGYAESGADESQAGWPVTDGERHRRLRDARGSIPAAVHPRPGRRHHGGWLGPSGSRYLRLVFANEPAERLTDLRARFDTALS